MKKEDSVQAVLLNEKGEVLAVSRKDDHTAFGLVGGKVDPGETHEEAMIREAKEETGLDITIKKMIFATHKNGRMGYTYLCNYEGEIYTEEPHVVKWTTFNEIINGPYGNWNHLVYKSLRDMDIDPAMKYTCPCDCNPEQRLRAQWDDSYTVCIECNEIVDMFDEDMIKEYYLNKPVK